MITARKIVCTSALFVIAFGSSMFFIQYDVTFNISARTKEPLTVVATPANLTQFVDTNAAAASNTSASNIEDGNLVSNSTHESEQLSNDIESGMQETTNTTATSSSSENTPASNEKEVAATETETGPDLNPDPITQNESKEKLYSILPKRVYSVIGLEDSGTTFVTRLIKDALGHSNYRNGSLDFATVQENRDVYVQHFSLPWGSTCQNTPDVPILDVVLPPQCSQKGNNYSECSEMTKELWGFSSNYVEYPKRYNLDIVSHKEAMSKWGVEQFFIIVLRDSNTSHKARKRNYHCTIESLAKKEEETGRDIIIDAINKYVLESPNSERKITRETYDFWHAELFQGGRRRRRLNDGRALSMESLPMGNNVVLVSYETMMLLKDPYIQFLYQALGIESDYMPPMKDANSKYIQ